MIIKNILLTNPLILFFLLFSYSFSSCGQPKPDSRINGVQVGAITWSWRSMPTNAQDIINYCVEAGINSIELLGPVAEEFAGIPTLPPSPGESASQDEMETYRKKSKEIPEKQREWRLSAPMDNFKEMRKMFDQAGVNIHAINFKLSAWSDQEIDYAFQVAKALGAKGVSTEIGHEVCKRLGEFAEKHSMYAIFHNHRQPDEPGFSFKEFLDYSPRNMLNLDVGHYAASTGKHPNEIIQELHDRIFSVHLRDMTQKSANPPFVDKPWGEGIVPISDVLKLIQKKAWPIYCDIELAYTIPNGSDAQKEVIKCLDYCRKVLLSTQ